VTKIVIATGFHSIPDLAGALPDDEVVIVRDGGFGPASGAEVAVAGNDPDRASALLAALPTLRWYHTLAAGVDRLLPAFEGRDDLVLTNNSGSYDASIAEHVIASIFAAAKHLPRSFAAQQKREWHDDPHNAELRDATLVVVGMGSIGGEVARLARAVGMRVVGVRRRAGDGAVGVDRLAEVAAEADYLAVCAPLTEATRGLVGAEVIARLKPTAWVINIARGPIVDEAALLAACREGRIGGAALDAWWTEPLPADSEWWSLPNVIVTPHSSYSSPNIRERSLALIVENVRRFKAGESLLNVVDKRAGY
jgi:phosphoglycerate dehydrogenase-like enzyme